MIIMVIIFYLEHTSLLPLFIIYMVMLLVSPFPLIVYLLN